MINKSVESQAREYVYDVKNCASEFGQSTLDGWEFNLVTDDEKKKIEKEYYPTVAAHPAHEALFELFNLVKGKLLLPASNGGDDINPASAFSKTMTHLIAFNPKMHR